MRHHGSEIPNPRRPETSTPRPHRWSWRRDSNPGPRPYQGRALPAELRQHRVAAPVRAFPCRPFRPDTPTSLRAHPFQRLTTGAVSPPDRRKEHNIACQGRVNPKIQPPPPFPTTPTTPPANRPGGRNRAGPSRQRHPGPPCGPLAPGKSFLVERAMGIEPTWPAWKAGALPLSYARNRRLRPPLSGLRFQISDGVKTTTKLRHVARWVSGSTALESPFSPSRGGSGDPPRGTSPYSISTTTLTRGQPGPGLSAIRNPQLSWW
jgi:hypothetical protein